MIVRHGYAFTCRDCGRFWNVEHLRHGHATFNGFRCPCPKKA